MVHGDWEARALQFRQLRISLNLTTLQVGRRAGLDRSSISTYETRRARPSARALENWQAALVALAKEVRANAQVALIDLGAP